jgi:isoamylase
MHVRGFTKLFPKIKDKVRGTYAGLGQKEVVDYIRSLGVTSVELLPIHSFVNDSQLLEKGLTNYWGYNSIAFLAPDSRGPGYTSLKKHPLFAPLNDAKGSFCAVTV